MSLGRARRVMGIGVGGERVREVRGSPQQTVAGVVVMSLCEGLCVHLRFRATLTGYVAAGRGGQERGLAARAMRCVYGTHRMYDTSGSRTRVDLRVCA